MTRTADALLDEARRKFQRVSPREAQAAHAAGALLIDIRPVAQRAQHGHVPGALIIERNVLEWRLDPSGDHRLPEVSDHERQVLVICQQGYASSFAAASLADLGYVHAGDVDGGFDAWAAAGLPVEGAG